MTFCLVHNCKMTSDSTCKARLAEVESYEKKGIRGGLVLGNELSRYEEFLLCRTCKGMDATKKKLTKRNAARKGQRKTPELLT